MSNTQALENFIEHISGEIFDNYFVFNECKYLDHKYYCWNE